MSAEGDKLTVIKSLSELKELQNLYLQNWPSNCVPYFWLENYLQWLKKDQVKHLTFYTLNNNWQEDGLFLILHRYQLYFANLSQKHTNELKSALALLDWSNGFKISSLHESHYIVCKRFMIDRQIEFHQENKTIMYYMPSELAKSLTVKCPEDFELKALRLQDAILINEHWSARHHGSLKLIQLLITHNISVGVFGKQTGELCAWCLRLQSGFLGALEVRKDHQRRGLGALLVSAMAKRISLELSQDVTALVYVGNTKASNLFEKLGFELRKDDYYFWSMSLPTSEDSKLWVDDN